AWGKVLGGVAPPASETTERKDRRFAAPEWRENPIFDAIRQTYLRISDQMLGTVDEIENVDPGTREKLRFATKSFVDAMSPSNFALTNPQVLKKTLETRGENLLKGLSNMLRDIAQGISLFMVSWKSADETIADVGLDDYVQRGQIDAIDTVRDLLGVEAVHAIGYCVAGTTLAATLAYLQTKDEADKVKSATFLTAQVDFTEAGDLKLFSGPEVIGLIEELTKDKGFLDGRYMAATFNLLRGRDLIWSYVV